MRTFELNIFIDCPRDKVYDHLSEPINMIGLLPSLTTIDVLKERNGENGTILRPYNTVETFRLAGLVKVRSRTYSVIHLRSQRRNSRSTSTGGQALTSFSNTRSTNRTGTGRTSHRLSV